jgi:hypothetical protein
MTEAALLDYIKRLEEVNHSLIIKNEQREEDCIELTKRYIKSLELVCKYHLMISFEQKNVKTLGSGKTYGFRAYNWSEILSYMTEYITSDTISNLENIKIKRLSLLPDHDRDFISNDLIIEFTPRKLLYSVPGCRTPFRSEILYKPNETIQTYYEILKNIILSKRDRYNRFATAQSSSA